MLPSFGSRSNGIAPEPHFRYSALNMATVRISLLILLLFLAGCHPWGTGTSRDAQFEETARKIDALRQEAETTVAADGNIRIVVNKLSTGISDYTHLEALFRYTDRHVTVANRPENFGRSGLMVGVATEQFQAALNLARERIKTWEDASLFVVVSDGAMGYINIGKEIVVPRFFYAGRRYHAVDYTFRQAGRSLEVTPHLLPSGAMQITLTPVFSKLLGSGGDLTLTELTTTVIAQPGQTIVIGGGDSTGEDVATALFSYRKGGEEGKTVITVTPVFQ